MRTSQHGPRHWLLAWSVLATFDAAAQAWPVPSSSEVLHSFGTPIRVGVPLLHAGVDILGFDLVVVAVRPGTVQVLLGASECNQIGIKTTSGGASQTDRYVHVRPDVESGERVAAGARLGTISTNCPNHQGFEHLHWEIAASTSASASLQFANPLSVLAPALRDPNSSPAAVADVDGVQGVLRVVARNQTSGSDAASGTVVIWGSVDLIVDASDDMSPGRDMDVAPYQLAYWIESLQGGTDVASSSQPYQLFCFGAQKLDQVALDVVCDEGTCSELDEPSDTPWPRFLSWAVTKATRRRPAGQPCETWLPPTAATGFWKTNAPASSACTPNGTGCSGTASSNGLAHFPDGLYRLHVEVSDLTHAATPWHQDLVVDNWAPHVRRVAAGPAGAEVDLYEVVSAAATPTLVVRTPPATTRAALIRPGQTRLRLRATFSEPVVSPSLAIGGASRPRLAASQGMTDQRTWVWDLDAAEVQNAPADEIRIWAVDLAGNPLVPITRSRRPPKSSHPPLQPRPQVISF